MAAIWFKWQGLGQWRRDENESSELVTEDAMYKEMFDLYEDGWDVYVHGTGGSDIMFEIVNLKIPPEGPLPDLL